MPSLFENYKDKITFISLKKRTVRMHVIGCPPWKQQAADSDERIRQKERRALLEQAAKEIFIKGPKFAVGLTLSIRYRRNIGRCDATNIIGGIADSLQDIVYFDDREIREVHYIEENWSGEDEYWVTVDGQFEDD